jgi:hypothetical protein
VPTTWWLVAPPPGPSRSPRLQVDAAQSAPSGPHPILYPITQVRHLKPGRNHRLIVAPKSMVQSVVAPLDSSQLSCSQAVGAWIGRRLTGPKGFAWCPADSESKSPTLWFSRARRGRSLATWRPCAVHPATSMESSRTVPARRRWARRSGDRISRRLPTGRGLVRLDREGPSTCPTEDVRWVAPRIQPVGCHVNLDGPVVDCER